MIEDLVETVETLRQRIRDDGSHIGRHEKRTRVSLIDPMLCALGWDVANPRIVEVETKTTDGWADYALLDGNEQPFVFVEAKKLAERDPPIAQVVGYATQENARGANVRYCVCTNGDYWQLLDIRSQQPTVFTTYVSGKNPAKIALSLLGLWRDSLSDGHFHPAVEPVLQKPVSTLDVPAATGTLSPLKEKAAGWTSLDIDFPHTGQPPPSELRLPDGTEKQIANWRHILIETSTWLFLTGALTAQQWREPFGKKYLFSQDGKNPKNDSNFVSGYAIQQGRLYVETSLSNKGMLRYTKQLLIRCGYTPSQVSVRLPSNPQ